MSGCQGCVGCCGAALLAVLPSPHCWQPPLAEGWAWAAPSRTFSSWLLALSAGGRRAVDAAADATLVAVDAAAAAARHVASATASTVAACPTGSSAQSMDIERRTVCVSCDNCFATVGTLDGSLRCSKVSAASRTAPCSCSSSADCSVFTSTLPVRLLQRNQSTPDDGGNVGVQSSREDEPEPAECCSGGGSSSGEIAVRTGETVIGPKETLGGEWRSDEADGRRGEGMLDGREEPTTDEQAEQLECPPMML